MCIAIYKPQEKLIPKETLEQCFQNNSDGAGFGFIAKGRMKIRKGFFDFPSFWEAYKPLQNKQMLIHFRIKTHGEKSISNCHPFYVNNNLIMIHNGIISKHPGDTKVSDTMEFNYKIVRPLVKQFGEEIVLAPAFEMLAKDYIGFSKLVFLQSNGNFSVVNEKMGAWEDGVWYSNSSYKKWLAPSSYELAPYLLSNNNKQKNYHKNSIKKYRDNDWKRGDIVVTRERHKGLEKGESVILVAKSEMGWDVEDFYGALIPAYPEYFLKDCPY